MKARLIQAGRAAAQHSPNDVLSAIASLARAAHTAGPAQRAAAEKLIEIATEACWHVESLWVGGENKQLLESIARQRESFPATFSKRSTENIGDVMRASLTPKLLQFVAGRDRKKGLDYSEITAGVALRLMVEAYMRSVLFPNLVKRTSTLPTFEIEPHVSDLLLRRANRKNAAVWAKVIADDLWSPDSPQPASWIEALIGRRSKRARYHFRKLIRERIEISFRNE